MLRGNRKILPPEAENMSGENEWYSADFQLFESLFGAVHEEGFRVCNPFFFLLYSRHATAARGGDRKTDEGVRSRD